MSCIDTSREQEGSNFVDTLSLNLFSGRGGSGGVAFHREKFMARGPPSGGPGGAGGSVYLLATPSLTSLAHLPRTARASPGSPGGSKWLSGKRGEDVIVRVPVGTVLREVRLASESVEVEREKEDRQELEWAWEVSRVRLAESEKREKRWDAWKLLKEKREKEGGDKIPAFEEDELEDLGEEKEGALERVRKDLFVMYPMADLSSHPQFLKVEHQLLSKLLSREADLPGRSSKSRYLRRRRRNRQNQLEEEPLLYMDLDKPTPLGEPILLLSGGQPGLGNASFQTADDRSPKYALRGGDGDVIRLELELKAGGEVGLVGMPNAGKSTLLRALTSSTPRVASYAFTTLNPHQGTCVLYSDGTFSGPSQAQSSITDSPSTPTSFSGTTSDSTTSTISPDSQFNPARKPHRTETLRFTLTDNPGLISGSSLNVGLGHAFLRHVERCSALVYVVDMSSPDPVGALKMLKKELREYSVVKGLEEGVLEGRVRGVVGNKADRFGEASGPVESAIDEEEGAVGSPLEGKIKLDDLIEFVKAMEAEEIEEGIRDPEGARVWVVPTSARERMNMPALIKKLEGTVRDERRKEKERADEEERLEEEERERAIDALAGGR